MTRPDRQTIIILVIGLWLVVLGGWALWGRSTTHVDSYATCAEQGYPVTDTQPPTCSAAGHTFVGSTPIPSATANSGPTGTAVPFDLLVEGDSGGTYPNRQELINNSARWQSYWREVHANISPLPPLLPLNFIDHDVVALSEGQKTTGGYGLKVTAITTSSKGTVVDVAESIPTVTCHVTTSLSNRYYIVRAPKLTPPVSFRITTEHRRCS